MIGEEGDFQAKGLSIAHLGHAACGRQGYTLVPVANPTDEEVTMPAGLRYGSWVDLEPRISTIGPSGTADPDPSQASTWNNDQKRAWLDKEFRFKDNAHMTTEQRRQALDLLLKYWEVFSVDGSFGCTDLVEHEIYTQPGHPPIRCRYRPVNPTMEKCLQEQLDAWKKHDVIEESNSPWNFPLVAVPKKNGKTRWCIDFRRLNDITQRDAFPLPLIEDNLGRLSGSQWFSGIDGSGAFHVVQIKEEDRGKTAFATPWGQFHFKRMPFGLSNGPATYSRLVQLALKDIPSTEALPYLDDTVIHAATFTLHLQALEKVLRAHQSAGLRLQPSKCQLFRKKIEYLGHEVSGDGVRPMPGYLNVVKDWPMPKTKTEARTFLGKCGYYRRFIKNYAAYAAEWTDKIGKEVSLGKKDKLEPIEVTPSMERSFHLLKEALLSAPVLAYPRFQSDEPFIVDTDWSYENRCIGGVLSQVQDGKERVICYGAKKLNPAQSNYGSTKGELFAMTEFLSRWKYFLRYQPFILRTDHQALKYIRSLETPTGMIQRWLATLAEYDFKVMFRPGKKHGNADHLSRIQHADEASTESGDDESICLLSTNEKQRRVLHALRHLGANQDLPSLPEEWKRHQLADAELREVYDCVSGDWPPKGRSLGPIGQHYYQKRTELSLDQDGVLRYQPNSSLTTSLTCVPSHLQTAVVKRAHLLCGHRAVEATMGRVLASAYFPRLRAKVTDYVVRCIPCQQKSGPPKAQHHTAASVVDGYPFQRISIDFVGPLKPSKKGNFNILTVKCTFTKWIEAFPLRRPTADATANILEKEIIARYGYPETIHSDQGRQFTSNLLKELGRACDIKTTTTPAYNPKSNPVERVHRDLKATITALMAECPSQDWEELLPQALFACRMTLNQGTQLSPFQLLFGRDPSIPLTNIEPLPPGDDTTLSDYVQRFKDRVVAVHDYARRNIGKSIQRQQRYYRDQRQDYLSGDEVWLYTPLQGQGIDRKFTTGWSGPWKVVSKNGATTYLLQPPREWHFQHTVLVGIDRLRPYHQPLDGATGYPVPEGWTARDVEQLGNEELEDLHLPRLPDEGPAPMWPTLEGSYHAGNYPDQHQSDGAAQPQLDPPSVGDPREATTTATGAPHADAPIVGSPWAFAWENPRAVGRPSRARMSEAVSSTPHAATATTAAGDDSGHTGEEASQEPDEAPPSTRSPAATAGPTASPDPAPDLSLAGEASLEWDPYTDPSAGSATGGPAPSPASSARESPARPRRHAAVRGERIRQAMEQQYYPSRDLVQDPPLVQTLFDYLGLRPSSLTSTTLEQHRMAEEDARDAHHGWTAGLPNDAWDDPVVDWLADVDAVEDNRF